MNLQAKQSVFCSRGNPIKNNDDFPYPRSTAMILFKSLRRKNAIKQHKIAKRAARLRAEETVYKNKYNQNKPILIANHPKPKEPKKSFIRNFIDRFRIKT